MTTLFKHALGAALLLAAGPLLAQQMETVTSKSVDANGDTVETVRYVPARPVVRTAEDSARERRRIENSRRLRQERQQGVEAAKELNMKGIAAPAPLPPPPPPAPEAQPDKKALERAARTREKAAREAEEADRKRQKTLEKRTRED